MENQNIYEELKEQIRILKLNEEGLTPEQKNGEFKKPMARKREKVMRLLLYVVNEWMTDGCWFNKKKAPEDIQKFEVAYGKYIDENIDEIKGICMEIFQHFSWQKVLEDLEPFHRYVVNKIYAPILFTHCKKIEDRIINPIIDMEWEPQINCWIKPQADGSINVCFLPAPAIR